MSDTTPSPTITTTDHLQYDPVRLRVETLMQLGDVKLGSAKAQARFDTWAEEIAAWVVERAEEAYLVGIAETTARHPEVDE